MSILDDAIREHLELKRKHGAPESEIEEQEKEALGPPASKLAPASAEPLEEPPFAEDDQAPGGLPDEDQPSAPALDEEPLVEPEGTGLDEELPLEPEEPAVADEPAPPPSRDFFAKDEEEPFADDVPAAPAEPDDETEAEEDLLEETPEFLQESPDQDRLWFEQKPPKDFDFDD